MEHLHLTPEKLEAVLAVARFAPSVHNTQPWLVRPEGNGLVVTVDPDHILAYGDPTGRETMISLGIFTEAIDIGARTIDLQISETTLRNKSVRIKLSASSGSIEQAREMRDLLCKRCSDRSIYKPVDISSDIIHNIESATSAEIAVQALTDKVFIGSVANLTSKGIQMALSSPGFRKELSQYLVVPWSKKQRGISIKSLYISPLAAYLQPIILGLGLSLNKEARLEKRRWESASAVVVISGEGDMPPYWLSAGRAYLRVSLAIEKAGLAQATSAAIVEASNFHEDIEEYLNTSRRVLAMIRIGDGSTQKYYSPRVSVSEILT